MEKYQPELVSSPILIELHHLPCLDYMAGFVKSGQVWIEACEHYQKQSYRNRCYVRAANKVDVLTVPVRHGTSHPPIRSVKVDNSQSWQKTHWRCLRGAYGKAPFFDYYAPDFEPVYQKTWSFLVDLNLELLTICLKLLRVSVSVNLTDWYAKDPPAGFVDARSVINRSGRVNSYVFHRAVPYQQNFGPDFVPNLSIIDLLFCQGPGAGEFLV